MTIIDEDARDLAIHAAIDHLAQQIMRANGLNRRQALERLVCFCENDEESPVYAQTAPLNAQKRRRAAMEARA